MVGNQSKSPMSVTADSNKGQLNEPKAQSRQICFTRCSSLSHLRCKSHNRAETNLFRVSSTINLQKDKPVDPVKIHADSIDPIIYTHQSSVIQKGQPSRNNENRKIVSRNGNTGKKITNWLSTGSSISFEQPPEEHDFYRNGSLNDCAWMPSFDEPDFTDDCMFNACNRHIPGGGEEDSWFFVRPSAESSFTPCTSSLSPEKSCDHSNITPGGSLKEIVAVVSTNNPCSRGKKPIGNKTRKNACKPRSSRGVVDAFTPQKGIMMGDLIDDEGSPRERPELDEEVLKLYTRRTKTPLRRRVRETERDVSSPSHQVPCETPNRIQRRGIVKKGSKVLRTPSRMRPSTQPMHNACWKCDQISIFTSYMVTRTTGISRSCCKVMTITFL